MSSDSTAFQAECPSCGKTLKLPASALGKQGRCPGCKTVFQIPGAPEPTAFDAPASSSPFGAAPANPASPFSGGPTSSEVGLGMGLGAPGMVGIQNDPWGQPTGNAAPGAAWPGAPANPWQAPGAWPSPPGGPSYGGAPFPNNSMTQDYMARAAVSQAEADARAREAGAEGGTGINSGVVGGIAMMVGAVIWFFVGLMFDWVFFYPPILFIIGVIAVVKGLIQGNITGRG